MFLQGLCVIDRQLGIEFLHFAPHGGYFHSRIDTCPYYQGRRRRIDLREGIVDDQRRNFSQALVLAVLSDSYYLKNVCVPRVQTLADRILARPKSLRERFVDDNYSCRFRSVAPGKIPSTNNRNPHRRKVIRAHALIDGRRHFFSAWFRLSLGIYV